MLWIACAALVVMMITVVGDVALRALFNRPIRGTYDVVNMTLLVMVTFGIAPVVAERSEILIDLIDAMLPPAALRALALLAGTIGICIFAFCGWAMLAPARDAWQYGDRSLELGVPQWLLWAATFCSILGIFWAYLLQLRASLRAPGPPNSEEGGL